MSKPQEDHAFKALKETAEKLEFPVSQSLLLDLYTIQREHQFDTDRSTPMKRMEQRILAEVDNNPPQPERADTCI